MSDIQDKINQILNNPEALKQVQSLGEQLGLNTKKAEPHAVPQTKMPDFVNDDMLKTITTLAPVMQSVKGDDDTTRLLDSLRPFLSSEKQHKLDSAEKMLRLIKIIPLLKENNLF